MMLVTMAEPKRDVLEEATEWFARLDSGDFTQEDIQQFEAWRLKSPAHDAAFERVQRTWAAPDMVMALEPFSPEVEPVRRNRLSFRSTRWLPAASIAASVLIAGLWFMGDPILMALRADVLTSVGEQKTVRLPDKSSMILNTNTAVVTHVDGKERRVELLKGEAFFQVQADPNRPFTVQHAEHQVQVLGTEFIVRERQKETTVTVVKGLVRVSGSVSQSRELIPGQQISIGTDGELGPIRDVAATDAMAWTRRRLVVSDTPLSDVIAEIQRYHPGYVLIWNDEIRSIRVTGIYDLANTAETLSILAKTLPIQLDKLTDRFIILR
ncbi:iron dicitrate transporter FecR [Nitrospira sp. KM1]|uniref:FecR family protein n=1 Tax=Nitrospira sp. KM1 TaxID=1936990 RepID=UPI0013A7A1B2|nr:FecR family protein [Nitrospira sp. KM1]BCA56574.1 iron dicitrate transporter FecR [Nitrospira sp. KM1]